MSSSQLCIRFPMVFACFATDFRVCVFVGWIVLCPCVCLCVSVLAHAIYTRARQAAPICGVPRPSAAMWSGVPPTEAALRRWRQRRRAAIIETRRTAGDCGSLTDGCAGHLELKSANNKFIKEMAAANFDRMMSAGVLTAAVVPNVVTFNSLDIRKAEEVFETMTTVGVFPNCPDVVKFNVWTTVLTSRRRRRCSRR